MPDGNRYYRLIILEELGKCVNVKTNSMCTKISKEGIFYKDAEGAEQFLPVDTVILAAGRRPRRAEMTALLNAAPRVYEVGDVIAQKDIMTATYLGYHAALDV